MRQLDALLGVLNIAPSHRRIGIDKILVNRKADQIHAIHERRPLQLLQIAQILAVHLAMQDVHAFNLQRARFFDHFLNRRLRRAEMPVGIGRDAQLHRIAALAALAAIRRRDLR